jgi:hypothetical protein
MSEPEIRPPEPALSREGTVRHGFGLKNDVLGELAADYHSELIEAIRANGFEWTVGGLKLRLAKTFGFCYGVDKAVDLAYETHRQFPDRHILLTNEIIHNPRVNRRLLEMGIRILSGQYADGTMLEEITARDVVILPAFGVAACWSTPPAARWCTSGSASRSMPMTASPPSFTAAGRTRKPWRPARA